MSFPSSDQCRRLGVCPLAGCPCRRPIGQASAPVGTYRGTTRRRRHIAGRAPASERAPDGDPQGHVLGPAAFPPREQTDRVHCARPGRALSLPRGHSFRAPMQTDRAECCGRNRCGDRVGCVDGECRHCPRSNPPETVNSRRLQSVSEMHSFWS